MIPDNQHHADAEATLAEVEEKTVVVAPESTEIKS